MGNTNSSGAFATQNKVVFNHFLFSYYTFDISWWRRYIHDDIKNLPNFLSPMLTFIEDCLKGGGSVLVHCLMGAHRAGTTGVICVMHFRGTIISHGLQI